jgi:hypothetical protein
MSLRRVKDLMLQQGRVKSEEGRGELVGDVCGVTSTSMKFTEFNKILELSSIALFVYYLICCMPVYIMQIKHFAGVC